MRKIAENLLSVKEAGLITSYKATSLDSTGLEDDVAKKVGNFIEVRKKSINFKSYGD